MMTKNVGYNVGDLVMPNPKEMNQKLASEWGFTFDTPYEVLSISNIDSNISSFVHIHIGGGKHDTYHHSYFILYKKPIQAPSEYNEHDRAIFEDFIRGKFSTP